MVHISRVSVGCSLRCFNDVLPLAIVFALPVAAGLQLPAQAVSFRFDFGSDVSPEFREATREAGNAWSSVLKDDAIVELRIEYTDLSEIGGNVLGGAQPGRLTVNYDRYINALFQDAVSGNDYTAINSLQLSSSDRESLKDFRQGARRASQINLNSTEFNFLTDNQFLPGNGQGASSAYDNNGSRNNRKVSLTRAQAKALGIERPQKRGLDAIVKINSSVAWDSNRNDGIDSDKYDLSSVLQHEIGHALGIVSSVDALDFLATSNQADKADDTPFSYLTPMDFYRYSRESSDLGLMDLTLGSDTYFSLDSGRSEVRDWSGRVAAFSTGSSAVGGDGYQGSHWKDTFNSLGVMDPSLRKGQSNQISSLDRTLLDVIGWDLEDSSLQRSNAIGLNLQGYKQRLADERQDEIDKAVNVWGSSIPQLEAAIDDLIIEADFEVQRTLQDRFDDLARKLLDEGGSQYPNYRIGEINNFYETVGQSAATRSAAIRNSVISIRETDQKVSGWLTLSTEALSAKLESASATEINRLSNIVKAAPTGERWALQKKLKNAIAPFADRPSQLVKDLLDTSGPANPIGYGSQDWWFWFQESGGVGVSGDGSSPVTYYSNLAYLSADEDDGPTAFSGAEMSLTAIDASINASSQAAQDIPEPGSVLAMFGISVLGAGFVRRRQGPRPR